MKARRRRKIHSRKDVLKKIKQLKKDTDNLERVKKGQIGARKEGKAKLVGEKYRLKRKILTTVTEK